MGCGGPRAAEEVKRLDLLDEASDEALIIFQPSLPVSAPQQPPVTLFQKPYLPSLRELNVDLPGENGCSGNLPFLRKLQMTKIGSKCRGKNCLSQACGM